LREKTPEEKLEDIRLDDYCSDILKILWNVHEMRFNEIHRALLSKGIKLTKPTLSEHLEHLKKKKFIQRSVKDAQNVAYRVHDSIKRPNKKALNFIFEKLEEEGVIIHRSPPEVTAELDIYSILRSKIEETLQRIEIECNIPELSLSFGNSNARIIENSVILKSQSNEEYKKRYVEKSQEILNLLLAWHNERLKK
jgi:predicted transcriptional regulator